MLDIGIGLLQGLLGGIVIPYLGKNVAKGAEIHRTTLVSVVLRSHHSVDAGRETC